MDFDEKDDVIILLLLVASGVTNLLRFLPKSREHFVWVKRWLQRGSTNFLVSSSFYIRKHPMIIVNTSLQIFDSSIRMAAENS